MSIAVPRETRVCWLFVLLGHSRSLVHSRWMASPFEKALTLSLLIFNKIETGRLICASDIAKFICVMQLRLTFKLAAVE